MKSSITLAGLKEEINNLEDKQSVEWLLLKEDVFSAFESMKLINVIKSTLKQAISNPDIKANIVDTAMGLTTGFLAKKAIIGNTNNPFKKLFGLILEMTVANKIAHHAVAIKTVGSILLSKLMPSKEEPVQK